MAVKLVRLQMEEIEVDAIERGLRTPIGRHHELQTCGTQWRVRGENVAIEDSRGMRPKPRLMDYEGALCGNCKQRKPRKGGKNGGHQFICAECL